MRGGMCHVPVIPATQEVEEVESLEPGRQRLRRAEIATLHSILGNKSKTPSQQQQKKDYWGKIMERKEIHKTYVYYQHTKKSSILKNVKK